MKINISLVVAFLIALAGGFALFHSQSAHSELMHIEGFISGDFNITPIVSTSTTTQTTAKPTTTTAQSTTTTTTRPVSAIPTPRGTSGWSFGVPIDRAGWMAEADSFQAASWSPAKAIDGSLTSVWHTPWDSPPPQPHWIIIDMQVSHWVDGMTITPRPYSAATPYTASGAPVDYEVWVSKDKNAWGRVASGTLVYDEIGQTRTIEFLVPNFVRYVKLVAISSTPSADSSSASITVIGDIDVMESLRDAVINAGGIN